MLEPSSPSSPADDESGAGDQPPPPPPPPLKIVLTPDLETRTLDPKLIEK